MISMAAANLPSKAIRQQISSAVSVVVQVSRLIDGKRKVTSIQEIPGMEGDVITMQEIFSFKQTGVGEGGAVVGYFSASGIRPRFLERLKSFGIGVSSTLFEPTGPGR